MPRKPRGVLDIQATTGADTCQADLAHMSARNVHGCITVSSRRISPCNSVQYSESRAGESGEVFDWYFLA